MMAALVLVIVVVLASGWRYHGNPHAVVTIAVGLFAGTLGGAVQISGPPIVRLLARQHGDAAIVRAN